MDQALISDEDKTAAQALSDKGWQMTPPDGSEWVACFTPQYYEAGGDEPGIVYRRVDLPDELYYSVVDAARQGLQQAERRLETLRAIDSTLDERVRNARTKTPLGTGEKPPAPVAMLDGVQLDQFEMRAVVARAADRVSSYKKALDRLDPTREPTKW